MDLSLKLAEEEEKHTRGLKPDKYSTLKAEALARLEPE
jgi:hypothetical protein